MNRRRLLLPLVTLVFLVAAKQRVVRHPGPPVPPADTFTFSNAAAVSTRHLKLDLEVDFDERVLRGTATLTIDNHARTPTLVLDTSGLTIHRVTLDGSRPGLWSLGAGNEHGQPLTIGIPPETRTVAIEYTTSPSANGLFWNSAEQSYGRVRPYLYSLTEPVGARSWIPIQDTPSTRMTYEATLRVPPDLLALMSAENNPVTTNASGVYSFQMTKTVPAYLIAIAVGRLEFRSFDERTGVYAEPELMEDAEWELQYVPSMMEEAEKIAGPYPFVRYDLLLMPPTFVAGGMEHPMLNFINPFSVVSGNGPATPEPKSLIAHELAHSWAGDLVTLATWNDVWLNEGITSYLTLRILEEVSGPERAELGYFLDRRSFAGFAQQPENQQLSILHHGVANPDDGFGATGYLKGELFIRMLEDRLGRAAIDEFLRQWFERYAWRWVDDLTFLAALDPFVPAGVDLRLEEWLYAPGLPSNVTAATSSTLYTRALTRADAFQRGSTIASLQPSTWSELDVEYFLQVVSTDSLRSRMTEVDGAFGLSGRVTPPFVWMLRAIAVGYLPARPGIQRVLMRGGTNSQVVQLYNALRVTSENRAFARAIFTVARDRYHPAVAASVEEMLNSSSAVARPAA